MKKARKGKTTNQNCENIQNVEKNMAKIYKNIKLA